MCTGWSEPLLVAHTTLLEISCLNSIVKMPHCWKYHVAAQIYFYHYRGKKRLEKSLETAKNDMTSLQEKLLNLQTGECVHLSHDVASGGDIMP